MFNWIVALLALLLWTVAALLYLRPTILRKLEERRKRREAEAERK